MRWFMVLVLCLGLAGTVGAQDTPDDIIITGAWTPANLEGESSPVYLTLENPTEDDISLTGVSTPASEFALLVEQGGELEAITLETGETLELISASPYIAIEVLAETLDVGDAISLTLTFERGGETHDVVIGVPVLEGKPEAAPITVLNAWARPTITLDQREHGEHLTEGVSAIYMQIINNGDSADRLLSIATDAAGTVEAHESTMSANGIMRMQHIHAIDLPVGELVELRPGGLHVMLMELQRGLAPGDALLATLTFESGLELVVAVPVYEPALP